MRKRILFLIVAIAVTAVAAGSIGTNPVVKTFTLTGEQVKKDTTLKTIYTCPMHAEVVQEKAGKCPKCGMNLEAKQVKKDVYTCPMHSDVLQDKAGKCPKCGMNLVKKEASKKSGNPRP